MTLSEKEKTVLSLLLVNYRPREIAVMRKTSAPNIYEFIRKLRLNGYLEVTARNAVYKVTPKGLKEIE
jgi:predicted transcriptional regulator